MPLMEYPVRKVRRPAFLRPVARWTSETMLRTSPIVFREAVGHAHPPRPAAEVPPVGEPGHGGAERPQRTRTASEASAAWRTAFLPVARSRPSKTSAAVQDPIGTSVMHGVQRRLEPDAIEHVARRRPARVDRLLHLGLDGIGDLVQERQCLDHALHEGLRHLFRLSVWDRYSVPYIPTAGTMSLVRCSLPGSRSRGSFVAARRAIQCAIRTYR